MAKTYGASRREKGYRNSSGESRLNAALERPTIHWKNWFACSTEMEGRRRSRPVYDLRVHDALTCRLRGLGPCARPMVKRKDVTRTTPAWTMSFWKGIGGRPVFLAVS